MAQMEKDEDKGKPLKIDGTLTVYEAPEIRKKLLQSFEKENIVTLDLKYVSDCDTAGVQLLYCALRTALKADKKVYVSGISEAIKRAANGIGLELGEFF